MTDSTGAGIGLGDRELARVRDAVLARRAQHLAPYLIAAASAAIVATSLAGEHALVVAAGGLTVVGVLFGIGLFGRILAARRAPMSDEAREAFVVGNLTRSTPVSRWTAVLLLAGLVVYLFVAEGAAGVAYAGWVGVGLLGSMWARLRWGRRWFGPTSLDLMVMQYYASHIDDPIFTDPAPPQP